MRTLSPGERSALPALVVIVGPTAVGKTSLSLRLADAVDAEIVSADSRQVYRGMDIGTAKASTEERQRVPHHLLDVVDPDETLGLAQFQMLAFGAIDDIVGRGKIPFLVGGTGQYVMAVVEGWKVPKVPPDRALRRELYRQADEDGPKALHDRLQSLDPEAARGIDARNVRRVVRALEVCLTTGQPISEQQRREAPPYRILILGLTMPRDLLYQRIDERVQHMMAAGLEREVRGLVQSGYGFDLPSMSGVGYGQFVPYLEGLATLEDVVRQIERDTRRFLRHQANWFRPGDSRIHWVDARREEAYDAALKMVQRFLKG